jgi:hypothetical protein
MRLALQTNYLLGCWGAPRALYGGEAIKQRTQTRCRSLGTRFQRRQRARARALNPAVCKAAGMDDHGWMIGILKMMRRKLSAAPWN